jgi:hypothetical protein
VVAQAVISELFLLRGQISFVICHNFSLLFFERVDTSTQPRTFLLKFIPTHRQQAPAVVDSSSAWCTHSVLTATWCCPPRAPLYVPLVPSPSPDYVHGPLLDQEPEKPESDNENRHGKCQSKPRYPNMLKALNNLFIIIVPKPR